jgi:glycosyltransferase involved in cell wall biosynthesis
LPDGQIAPGGAARGSGEGGRRRIMHVFPTFAVGGAQMRFVAVANHLARDAEHIVVSLDGRTDARTKLRNRVPLHVVLPGGKASGLRRALATLRAHRPDLVVTSNWGSMEWALAAKLLRLPHIHTEDGFGPDEQDRQKSRRVLARRLILRGSKVVLPSQTLLALARTVWRLPKETLLYVPNGVDLARFAGAAPVSVPGAEGPVIGSIAVLRAEKNFSRLLEAFAEILRRHRARLVIAGTGPELEALKERAVNLEIAPFVHFPGYTAHPEGWHATFDIFALSSDTEQMPLSVLEAMAAGKPVVSTHVGDVASMVAAENRPFIVPRDARSLAGALATLLSDPAKAAAIGAANRAKAEAEFADHAMFARWRGLLGVPDAHLQSN